MRLFLLALFTAAALFNSPPSQVRVLWTSAETARLAWEQQSAANTVCLSSVSGSGEFFNVIETCVPGYRGFHTFDLVRAEYPYGTYIPTMWDSYFITEWYTNGSAHKFLGRYGPFELDHAQTTYLPFVIR